MFGFGFYNVFIIAGMLGLQYFFSTRNSVYWGAIIPIAFLAVLTWMLVTNRIEHTLVYILILLAGMLFLIAEWNRGRKSLHKRREKELEKMATYDMK